MEYHHTFTSVNLSEHHFTAFDTHSQSTMSSQLPLASNMLTLMCWVFGDEYPFPVEISLEKTIGHLKKAIVSEIPNRFHGIDAVQLVLWKAEILDEDEAINAFDINGATKMRPTYKIGKYFTYPPIDHIHVVITVPGK